MANFFFNPETGRTVITTMQTFGCTCNRDIVRRLMGKCAAFKGMTFANAMEQFRTAERNGWVRKTSDYIVVEWCFD